MPLRCNNFQAKKFFAPNNGNETLLLFEKRKHSCLARNVDVIRQKGRREYRVKNLSLRNYLFITILFLPDIRHLVWILPDKVQVSMIWEYHTPQSHNSYAPASCPHRGITQKVNEPCFLWIGGRNILYFFSTIPRSD